MSHLVNIAFQGGTHGNFLRFFIDKFSSLTPDIVGMPFTENNTAHKKLNYSGRIYRYHPNFCEPFFENTDEPHILITIDKDDLCYLERIVTIRGGDHKVHMLEDKIKLHNNFLKDYNTWPSKFKKYYNIDLVKNKVPKFLIRDFYKMSFLDPAKSGFIELDTKLRNNLPNKTFCFPVSSFWDKTKFFNTLHQANQELQLNIEVSDNTVYDTFFAGLNFINTKNRSLDVIQAIQNHQDIDISNLDVVEQSFVSAWLEQNNDHVIVPMCNQFFSSTGEILDWLKYYPQHYKAMNPNLPTFNNIPNPFHAWNSKK